MGIPVTDRLFKRLVQPVLERASTRLGPSPKRATLVAEEKTALHAAITEHPELFPSIHNLAETAEEVTTEAALLKDFLNYFNRIPGTLDKLLSHVSTSLRFHLLSHVLDNAETLIPIIRLEAENVNYIDVAAYTENIQTGFDVVERTKLSQALIDSAEQANKRGIVPRNLLVQNLALLRIVFGHIAKLPAPCFALSQDKFEESMLTINQALFDIVRQMEKLCFDTAEDRLRQAKRKDFTGDLAKAMLRFRSGSMNNDEFQVVQRFRSLHPHLDEGGIEVVAICAFSQVRKALQQSPELKAKFRIIIDEMNKMLAPSQLSKDSINKTKAALEKYVNTSYPIEHMSSITLF